VVRERGKTSAQGEKYPCPFADDAVIAFADLQDAKRVLDVLGKCLARYELRLHPDKTRFVDFRSYRPDGKDHPDTDVTTFTFLGFCHVWGKVAEGQERGEAVNGQEALRPRAGGDHRLVPE
jgi:Reverse transcriptase (RNA-dependent DNA polymerase)